MLTRVMFADIKEQLITNCTVDPVKSLSLHYNFFKNIELNKFFKILNNYVALLSPTENFTRN